MKCLILLCILFNSTVLFGGSFDTKKKWMTNSCYEGVKFGKDLLPKRKDDKNKIREGFIDCDSMIVRMQKDKFIHRMGKFQIIGHGCGYGLKNVLKLYKGTYLEKHGVDIRPFNIKTIIPIAKCMRKAYSAISGN